MFDPSFIKLKYVFLKVQVFQNYVIIKKVQVFESASFSKITSLLKKYKFLKVQVFQNYVIIKKVQVFESIFKSFLCHYYIIPVLSHCYY